MANQRRPRLPDSSVILPENWGANDLENLQGWFEEAVPSITIPKKTLRRRGEHSTAAKCASPTYFWPDHYKQLPGEVGHAYRRLTFKDKKTQKVSLRIRISLHPYFVALRPIVGRQRDFRPDRQNLLDALFVLLVCSCDIATHIVTMNVSRLAAELSEKDGSGNIIPETAVTPTRVSRLLQDLCKFGLLQLPDGVQWDATNRWYFPKHVVLTEQAWKLTGVNTDKLYVQQDERLRAEADGVLLPGEELSVKAARKRWYNKMRHATVLRRRKESAEQKRANRLGQLPLDERLHEMSEHVLKTLPPDELYHLTPEKLEKIAWNRLHQLDLALTHSPPH